MEIKNTMPNIQNLIYVIGIKKPVLRFFHDFKNGRIQTAWSLPGAKTFNGQSYEYEQTIKKLQRKKIDFIIMVYECTIIKTYSPDLIVNEMEGYKKWKQQSTKQ